jgi:hypothetical protein
MFENLPLFSFAKLGEDQERLEQISVQLNRPISWTEIGFLLCFLAIAPLVAWLFFRRFGNTEPAEPAANPKALFAELCEGHQLGREERDLLEQLAKRAKLDPVARIFLEPDLLTDPQASELRPAQRLLLTALNVKLFGGQPLTSATRLGTANS